MEFDHSRPDWSGYQVAAIGHWSSGSIYIAHFGINHGIKISAILDTWRFVREHHFGNTSIFLALKNNVIFYKTLFISTELVRDLVGYLCGPGKESAFGGSWWRSTGASNLDSNNNTPWPLIFGVHVNWMFIWLYASNLTLRSSGLR